MPIRDLKLYLRSLAGAVVLCLILSATCAFAAFAVMKTADNSTEAAKVAVVANEGSMMERILINAVEKAYLSTLLDTTELDDEAEAVKGVENGEYVAAIVLPEGFIDDLSRGLECVGKIYLSDKASIQADTIRSVVSFGERLMMAGQNGVFAGERLVVDAGLPYDFHVEFNENAYNDLMEEALNFNYKYFDIETVDYHGTGMPTESYFVLCWLLLLLFLLSLFFIPLFQKDLERGLLNRLFSCGVGAVKFFGTKLALMFVTRIALLAAFVGVLGILEEEEIETPLLVNVEFGVAAVVLAVVGVAFVTFAGAALTVCFGDGITANVLSGLLGMFLCGGIVPRPMLPEAVLTVGRFTPFGAAKAFFEPMFGAGIDIAALIAAALYTVLAVFLIRNKLTRVMMGRN